MEIRTNEEVLEWYKNTLENGKVSEETIKRDAGARFVLQQADFVAPRGNIGIGTNADGNIGIGSSAPTVTIPAETFVNLIKAAPINTSMSEGNVGIGSTAPDGNIGVGTSSGNVGGSAPEANVGIGSTGTDGNVGVGSSADGNVGVGT